MRSDLGRFAYNGTVDAVDHAAGTADQVRRVSKEPTAVGALQLRIARRKMLADIAKTRRAQQGVGNRVKYDVGIAVTCQSAVVRNGNAAHYEWAFARKGVNVEANSGARDKPRLEHRFGARPI